MVILNKFTTFRLKGSEVWVGELSTKVTELWSFDLSVSIFRVYEGRKKVDLFESLWIGSNVLWSVLSTLILTTLSLLLEKLSFLVEIFKLAG